MRRARSPRPHLAIAAFAVLFAAFGAVLAGAQEEEEEEETPAADVQEAAGPRPVHLLQVRGAIGPSLSDYVVRGIDKAQEAGAALVVLEMDTPGGLDSSMRDIIKAILASTVPVATFVHPSGSRAASAGTYILYASHIAAMAPATNLGAATPVPIGGGGDEHSPAGGGKEQEDDAKDDEDAAPAGGAMGRKAVNDAIAYIRGLAELRGRNADWAERAVRHAESLSAEAALSENVIDLVARDVDDLLRQLDGRDVKIGSGSVRLATAGAPVTRVEPDWRTEFLDAITNPNVAYLLLLVGIYGLIFEGYNPGAVLPGVVGAIALLLAAYALQLLSVNYAGFALIALGIVLMMAEFFMPSFGALGIGGVIAFVIGSIILLDTDAPGFGISRTLIGSVAFVGGSLVFALIWFAARSRTRPVVSGREAIIGAIAVAETDFTDDGVVRLQGEQWQAFSATPIRAGERVRVIGRDGLRLRVERVVSTEG